MKSIKRLPLVAGLIGLCAGEVFAAQPALTIYNQNFGVVRETVPLDLKAGANDVQFVGATAYVEPASVVLRDPSGKTPLQILEQNYRGDPISKERLLELNEGKTIQFEVVNSANGRITRETISGKIIRAGSAPATPHEYRPNASEPIVEVNGKLRFNLPGDPIFPALNDGTILK